MSPEAWMLAVGIAALIASAVVFFVSRRMIAQGNAQIARCDEAVTKAGELIKALTAERDEALRQKAAQFEEWQADTARLRREIAELRDGQWQAFTALNKAQREIALLRPIADAAAALCDGKNLPGEFTALREAIRARKEAGK